jgi:hypothetical protein
MKCFLVSGALLISIVAIASPKITKAAVNSYDLDIELSLNGKTVFTPHVIVKRGIKAPAVTFNNGQNFLEVVADESAGTKMKKVQDGISMKFTVGEIEKDGAHKILGEPRIITLENQRAEVTSWSDGRDTQSVSVAVVAKRNPASIDEPKIEDLQNAASEEFGKESEPSE